MLPHRLYIYANVEHRCRSLEKHMERTPVGFASEFFWPALKPPNLDLQHCIRLAVSTRHSLSFVS